MEHPGEFIIYIDGEFPHLLVGGSVPGDGLDRGGENASRVVMRLFDSQFSENARAPRRMPAP